MQTNPLLTNPPNAAAPNTGGALGDYPQQFKAHLEGQGYRRQTVAKYVRCIEALGRLMRQHGVGLGDLDEAQTAALLAQMESPLGRRTSAKYVVRLFVRFLKAQGVPLPVATLTPKASARAGLRREYEEYLRRQRGLTAPPAYSPSLDRITMPHLSQFESADEYFSTLYHELCHYADTRIMPRRMRAAFAGGVFRRGHAA